MSDFFICVGFAVGFAILMACVNTASKWADEARKDGAIK